MKELIMTKSQRPYADSLDIKIPLTETHPCRAAVYLLQDPEDKLLLLIYFVESDPDHFGGYGYEIHDLNA